MSMKKPVSVKENYFLSKWSVFFTEPRATGEHNLKLRLDKY